MITIAVIFFILVFITMNVNAFDLVVSIIFTILLWGAEVEIGYNAIVL